MLTVSSIEYTSSGVLWSGVEYSALDLLFPFDFANGFAFGS